MQPHPESSAQETVSTDILSIKAFLNNRKSGLKLQGRYSYEDLKTEDPIHCEWEVRQEATGLTICGHLDGAVELECARCLEAFQVPIDVDLNERYVLSHYVDMSERERELQAEDFFEVVEEDGELDLKDLAHQFLIMETAEHATCGRPECKLASPLL